MTLRRITKHPILEIPENKEISFTWNGKKLTGYENEMISSTLFANGIQIFGHHPKDNSPQGLFCANGQCSQCLVIADGLPVKSCMTPLAEGMVVESVEGLPQLPQDDVEPQIHSAAVKEEAVLTLPEFTSTATRASDCSMTIDPPEFRFTRLPYMEAICASS